VNDPTVAPLFAVPSPGSPRRDSDVPSRPAWPKLDDKALHGPAGEIVGKLAPETEADPAALLLSLLVSFGSCIGAGPHVRADGAIHSARLFAVIVGRTSKARKGTSWSRIREIMETADPEWTKSRVLGGMSSGEGLIKAAAEGEDHRLLVHESEFARVLTTAAREGNTLSAVVRLAWDTGNLRAMTKEPLVADGVHVSMLAHITAEELGATLTGIQAANGFANRFLFACAKRSQLLPSGGKLDRDAVTRIGEPLRDIISHVKALDEIQRSTAADRLWDDRYRELARDEPDGLLGGVVSRGEAQLLRLSLVYALLDGSSRIEPDHIEAAWAMWTYCRESAGWLFGGRTGNGDADRIMVFLRVQPEGKATRDEIAKGLGKRLYGANLDKALEVLKERESILVVKSPTRGRTAEVIVLTERGQ